MKLSTFAQSNYLRIFEVDKVKLKLVGYHKTNNYILCECRSGKLLKDIGPVEFVNNHKPKSDAKFKLIRHSEIGRNSKWQETKNTLPKHKDENVLTIHE